MRQEFPSPLRQSRIRSKINLPVELILTDGTQIAGLVFIGLDERVQDLLNDPKPFFPVRIANGDVMLINKVVVAICKPKDAAPPPPPSDPEL